MERVREQGEGRERVWVKRKKLLMERERILHATSPLVAMLVC